MLADECELTRRGRADQHVGEFLEKRRTAEQFGGRSLAQGIQQLVCGAAPKQRGEQTLVSMTIRTGAGGLDLRADLVRSHWLNARSLERRGDGKQAIECRLLAGLGGEEVHEILHLGLALGWQGLEFLEQLGDLGGHGQNSGR